MTRFVDLSITLDNETVVDPPFLRPKITYQTSASWTRAVAIFEDRP